VARVRDLDHIFDAWPLDAEAAPVRASAERIAAEVDRALNYVEVAAGEAEHTDAAGDFAALFDGRWWFRRLRVRNLLRSVVWSPLVFAPGREVLVVASFGARRSQALLGRIERARVRADRDDLEASVAAFRAHEELLVDRARREMLARTSPRTELRCPRCGAHHVADDAYLGNLRMLGCRLCGHAESAAFDSPDLPLLVRRWGGS